MNKISNVKHFAIYIFIFFLNIITTAFAQTTFPGTVIAQSPTPLTRSYASPSIVILPDGSYVVSHDYTGTVSSIYRSTDNGLTWSFTTQVPNCHWATLFVHNNALYLMGTAKSFGNIVIYKSLDGGFSWTRATDNASGLLFTGRYHTGPVPVVVHNGRIWRAYEESPDPDNERDFHAFVLSAPANSDLLDASNWTKSNIMRFNESWLNAKRPNWFEGNIVVTPNGDIIDFMRLETWQAVGGGMPITTGGAAGLQRYEVAAKISVSADGSTISFNNTAAEYAHFPGSESKFTIRYDAASDKYWTIVSKISVFTNTWETYNLPSHQRNVLALYSSSDLVNWEHKYDIIKWNEGYPVKTWDVFGFQYADWQFDGNDIVAVSRTSWYGERYHNANLVTFHRIEGFRTKQLSDSPADLLPLTQSTPILSWKFSNPDAAGNQTVSTSTFTNVNLNVSTLSRGGGLTNTAGLLRSFNSTAPSPANSFTNAMANGQYLQFEVEPKSGYMASIHSIEAKLRRNSDGARYYKWAYSTDGTNFTEISDYNIPFTSTETEGVLQSSIHVGGLGPLQNLAYPHKATFRLVFWNASSSSGGFAIGRYPSGDDTPSLIVGGEIKAIPPTPPTLLAWQFSSLSGVTSGSLNANVNNNYLYTSTLSRGSGLTPLTLTRGYYSTPSSYGAAGSTANSKATAIANNDYYTFKVKPKTGVVASLSTLDARLKNNSNGPNMISWYYSLDGVNFTEITRSTNVFTGNIEGDIQPTVDLSAIPELQNLDDTKAVIFRVYGWGALTNSGGFGLGRYGAGDTTPSLAVGGSIIYNGAPPTEIIGWDFTGISSANSAVDTRNATTNDSRLVQSVLSKGGGLQNTTLTDAFMALIRNYNTTDVQNYDYAKSKGLYFEFALQPQTSQIVSLNALNASLRRNGSANMNYQWTYSLDNFQTEPITLGEARSIISGGDGVMQAPIDLSEVGALQKIPSTTTVTFRMYVWGFASASQNVGFRDYINKSTSLSVLGTINYDTTLPVYNLTFLGKTSRGKTVLLNWTTSSEKDNSYFEVLRSTDGKRFVNLGKVHGNGTTLTKSNYQYTDNNPFSGINYYQLKQVDFNGTANFSDVISVNVKLNESSFQVNAPEQKDIVNLFIKSINSFAVVEIYDVRGRRLFSQKIKLETDNSQIILPLALAKGVYIASLRIEGQPIISNKFVK